MIDALKANIERTIGESLTEKDKEAFSQLVFEKSVDKKVVLAEQGEICNHVYFVVSGSAYSYITDPKGNKHALQFALENYWISDLYSFFSGRNAIFTVETLEPCRLIVLNKENFQLACKTIPIFNCFFRILIQNAYVNLQYRIAKANSEEAETRYTEFSRQYPQFMQRIPQYLIASYLGIKPQSLSRIRKEMASKK
jgi:CRP-like cAMP-binding protein